MRILLLVPPREKSFWVMPPLGLGYIATVLLKKGYEVVILDAHAKRLDIRSIVRRINDVDPDVLGITMFSTDISAVNKISELVKKERPDMTILIGGPHPSSAPPEVLGQLPWVDYAFRGEGEMSLGSFMDALFSKEDPLTWAGRVPGLIYRTEGKVTCNEAVFYEDIDSFDYPPWGTHLDLNFYHRFMPTFQARTMKSAPMVITRGCPYKCAFCVGHKISGRKMRSRSLESVLSEIRLLYEEFKIEEILIVDDNFTHDRSFVMEFCISLMECNMKVIWTMPNGLRLDSLSEKMLSLMKKSGCHSLVVGIESGSKRILSQMKKGLNLDLINKKISLANRCGLPVHAFFILGYPGETIADIIKTERFALKLGIVGATFSLFCPLPGSEIRELLEKREEIDGPIFNTSKGSLAIPVYSPVSLSITKLKRLQQRILLRFYLRPKIIWYYIKRIFPLRRTLYFTGVSIEYFLAK